MNTKSQMQFQQRGTTNHSRGIIVIPARLQSKRLPQKLLLDRTGKPVLAHTIENALQAQKISEGLVIDVMVASDEMEMCEVARRSGVRAILTTGRHRCGTSRVAEALKRSEDQTIDFVVNLQADQPDLVPQAILRVIDCLGKEPDIQMATLAIGRTLEETERWHNPSVVKVALNSRNRAVYFSRSSIPYSEDPKNATDQSWYHHLGIYAYRTKFLQEFAEMPPCALELREDLEQLRAVDAGVSIAVGVIPPEWGGTEIDTASDYEEFVHRFRQHESRNASLRK